MNYYAQEFEIIRCQNSFEDMVRALVLITPDDVKLEEPVYVNDNNVEYAYYFSSTDIVDVIFGYGYLHYANAHPTKRGHENEFDTLLEFLCNRENIEFKPYKSL